MPLHNSSGGLSPVPGRIANRSRCLPMVTVLTLSRAALMSRALAAQPVRYPRGQIVQPRGQ
jgi:hypothetical protein